MNVTLKRFTIEPEAICAEAAALCTDYHGDPMHALSGAMKSGHESVLEHATATFLVEGVSRALLAQITRHRIASFSVQSQRYTGVAPTWVVPPRIKEKGFELSYVDRCNYCYELFCDMVSCGVPAEDARFVIPQGVTCRLMVTMNLRELRHFFSMRCCNRAQWEIRDLADRMLALCKKEAPDVFATAGPGCVRGYCPEGPRSCGHPRGADRL